MNDNYETEMDRRWTHVEEEIRKREEQKAKP
jgi:hypothetical protein